MTNLGLGATATEAANGCDETGSVGESVLDRIAREETVKALAKDAAEMAAVRPMPSEKYEQLTKLRNRCRAKYDFLQFAMQESALRLFRMHMEEGMSADTAAAKSVEESYVFANVLYDEMDAKLQPIREELRGYNREMDAVARSAAVKRELADRPFLAETAPGIIPPQSEA